MLPRPVVVADERAQPLDDAAGREVEEGLKLVIDAQNGHIALGVDREQTVEH